MVAEPTPVPFASLPSVERLAEVMADANVEPGYWHNHLTARSPHPVDRALNDWRESKCDMYRRAAAAALDEVALRWPGYVRRLMRSAVQLRNQLGEAERARSVLAAGLASALRQRDDARFELNRIRNGAPKCIAHGEPVCRLCSLNPASCDVEASSAGCLTYSTSGMHWDTCPNRVRRVDERGRWVLADGTVVDPEERRAIAEEVHAERTADAASGQDGAT